MIQAKYFLATFLILLINAADASVYIEYSNEMASYFKDPKSVTIVSRIIEGQSVNLYSWYQKENKVVTLINPSITELGECFSEDRLNDSCLENDNIERFRDSSSKFTISYPSTGNRSLSGLLFTSSGFKFDGLQEYLRYRNKAFKLWRFGRDNELFYLSFNDVDNDQLLAGMSPFKAKERIPLCEAYCTAGRQVDLYSECFEGIVEGYVSKVEYRYPSAPSSVDFLQCSSASRPPYFAIGRDLKLALSYGPKGFYQALRQCWSENNVTVSSSDQSDEIIMEVTLTVNSGRPDKMADLPRSVDKLLRNVLGADYKKPKQSVMILSLSDCD